MDDRVLIVGAGPTGLTLAWLLASAQVHCLLVDAAPAPGGCHRVDRSTNGLFSEHGPRIYSTAYTTTRSVFRSMGLRFNDYFVPYSFSSVGISQLVLKQLNLQEWAAFAGAFARFVVEASYGLDQSMTTFMTEHHFRPESVRLIDALCRLTDGARADRYSLNQFLQLLNQSLPTHLLQPRAPNDSRAGWVHAWTHKLLATGHIQLLLNTKVTHLEHEGGRVVSATLRQAGQAGQAGQAVRVQAAEFLLAIPPAAALPLLEASALDRVAFGSGFPDWVRATQYIDYLSVCYTWPQRLPTPKVYRPPVGDWGVVFIFLSDYFLPQYQPGTLLSVAVTTPDAPSTVTGKTAYETTDEAALAQEVLRQVEQALSTSLPPPATSVTAARRDTAWVHAAGTSFLPAQSYVENFALVGPHNGITPYAFTSMEAAVCAGVAHAAAVLERRRLPTPTTKVSGAWTVAGLLRVSVATVALLAVARAVHAHAR